MKRWTMWVGPAVAFTPAVAFAMCMAAVTFATGAAAAKLPSDRSVRVVANYAWANMPAKYTAPSGTVIITDKSNRKSVLVANDILKFVVHRGVYTGRAQNCELFEEQFQNLAALRRILRQKHKFTKQQSLYLHFLHLTAVQFVSGQFKIVGTDEKDRKLVLSTDPPKKVRGTCSAELKQRTKAEIDRFVAAAPPPRKRASTKPVSQPASGQP